MSFFLYPGFYDVLDHQAAQLPWLELGLCRRALALPDLDNRFRMRFWKRAAASPPGILGHAYMVQRNEF
jgi:hypothetical protein